MEGFCVMGPDELPKDMSNNLVLTTIKPLPLLLSL
jgi:hypothetical protein